tara:strand:+ start:558 stop:725 length:168 start_codon:yes stop_codon:yes gene_type:complete
MVDASKGERGVVKGLFDVLFHRVHYTKKMAQSKLITIIIITRGNISELKRGVDER